MGRVPDGGLTVRVGLVAAGAGRRIPPETGVTAGVTATPAWRPDGVTAQTWDAAERAWLDEVAGLDAEAEAGTGRPETNPENATEKRNRAGRTSESETARWLAPLPRAHCDRGAPVPKWTLGRGARGRGAATPSHKVTHLKPAEGPPSVVSTPSPAIPDVPPPHRGGSLGRRRTRPRNTVLSPSPRAPAQAPGLDFHADDLVAWGRGGGPGDKEPVCHRSSQGWVVGSSGRRLGDRAPAGSPPWGRSALPFPPSQAFLTLQGP